ncbi:MAG: hypothetical protein ACREA4_07625, partial [Nitrososphaera sp.]
MAIRNQGRPLFPVADRSLYKDVWEWAAKTKDSLEGFFNSNKVVFGPNLISNGSFESDTSAGPIVGWDLYHLAGNTGTGTMTGDSVNAYVGTRCMRLSRTAAPIAQVTGPMRI